MSDATYDGVLLGAGHNALVLQAYLGKAGLKTLCLERNTDPGGGLVTAVVSGSGELRSLTIDPKAVDPEDTETLADLIVAAVRDASSSAQQLAADRMGGLAGGLGGLGLPGM